MEAYFPKEEVGEIYRPMREGPENKLKFHSKNTIFIFLNHLFHLEIFIFSPNGNNLVLSTLFNLK
jgi:hypothetical protein